jgi:DNA-binding LacI/PurR family transcriptional regulator
MTVSRVVNDNGYVSSELRRKVQRVIEKLRYSPNRLARSLKGTPTNVIGVLLPDLENPFSSELARGIEEVLSSHGFHAFVISASRNRTREEAALRAFSDHRVEGAILAAPCAHLDPQVIVQVARERFPVVVVGSDFEGDRIDHVTARCREGGFAATAHLIESGRRRIAYIGANLDEKQPLMRFGGYMDALDEYGIGADPSLIIALPPALTWCSHRDGYDYMKRLLELPEPPDAVFTRNDFAALGALCALNEMGVKVPDDVAIVGFDNISASAYTAPPLTTVNQFVFDQGKASARVLLDRISGRRRKSHEEQFPCELIVRKSTGVEARVAA